MTWLVHKIERDASLDDAHKVMRQTSLSIAWSASYALIYSEQLKSSSMGRLSSPDRVSSACVGALEAHSSAVNTASSILVRAAITAVGQQFPGQAVRTGRILADRINPDGTVDDRLQSLFAVATSTKRHVIADAY